MGNIESTQKEIFEIKRYEQKAKVVLEKSKEIKKGGLVFYLNSFGETAFVIGNESAEGDILIPTYIEHNAKRYYVTCIFQKSFYNSTQIRSIQFSSDSKLLIIGYESFYNSSIERISIPPSVLQIHGSAFNLCKNLNHIEFASNSRLQTIEYYSFNECSIERILIPSSVTILKSYCFQKCGRLKTVEFQADSNLKSICEHAFLNSSIERILSIPSNVELNNNCFDLAIKLKEITIDQRKEKNIEWYDNKCLIGKTNQNQNNFDRLIFVLHDVESFTIPSFIREIGISSFNQTLIRNIIIPSQVACIKKNAFLQCKKLHKVEFQNNSELKTIDTYSFSYTSIKQISIPASVTNIEDGAFMKCENLKRVEIPSNSEIKIIGDAAFAGTKVKSLYIPKNAKKIMNYIFSAKFQILEFACDSLINIIDKDTFERNQKTLIMIPPGNIKFSEINIDFCEYNW